MFPHLRIHFLRIISPVVYIVRRVRCVPRFNRTETIFALPRLKWHKRHKLSALPALVFLLDHFLLALAIHVDESKEKK